MRQTDRQQVFGLSALAVDPNPRARASRGYCSVVNWRTGENCLALWFYGHAIEEKCLDQRLLLTLLLHMHLGQQHLLNVILLWKEEDH